MIFRIQGNDDNDGDRSSSHGVGNHHDDHDADTRTIGDEVVELLPSPATLHEHIMLERALSGDYIDQESEETTSSECVVSARLITGFYHRTEFIELSRNTDSVAELYPDTVWLKVRVIKGYKVIVFAALWLVSFFIGLILASHADQWWNALLTVGVITIMLNIAQRFVMSSLITTGKWYKMSYSSWTQLVKCMTLWDNEKVTHKHIYLRSLSFVNDVAECDEQGE